MDGLLALVAHPAAWAALFTLIVMEVVLGIDNLIFMVFSIDSILTAVGMTDEIAIMITAVLVTVGVMALAADPLANFIEHNPTVVMLALGFLLMIGTVLIADGFGVHVPKGYIYAAMGFSVLVEALNIMSRRRRAKAVARAASSAGH